MAKKNNSNEFIPSYGFSKNVFKESMTEKFGIEKLDILSDKCEYVNFFNKSYGLVGPSECGKTTAVRYILYRIRDIPSLTVFCIGETNVGEYGEIVNEECIYSDDEINAMLINCFIKRLVNDAKLQMKRLKIVYEMIRKYFVSNPEIAKKSNIDLKMLYQTYKIFRRLGFYKYIPRLYFPYVMVIYNFVSSCIMKGYLSKEYEELFFDHRKIVVFDDAMNEVWFDSKKGAPLVDFLIRGRHFYVTSFFIMQSLTGLGPIARTGYYHYFFLGSTTFFNYFYDLVKGMNGNIKNTEFRSQLSVLYSELTKSKGALVLTRDKSTENGLKDIVHKFNVPEQFVMSPPEFFFNYVIFPKNALFADVVMERMNTELEKRKASEIKKKTRN